jgi:hypothetical protein
MAAKLLFLLLEVQELQNQMFKFMLVHLSIAEKAVWRPFWIFYHFFTDFFDFD